MFVVPGPLSLVGLGRPFRFSPRGILSVPEGVCDPGVGSGWSLLAIGYMHLLALVLVAYFVLCFVAVSAAVQPAGSIAQPL